MNIHRNGSPTTRPPEATFSGSVEISDYFRRPGPSRLAGARVTFRPGARTPWKINPLGQTVIVTAGTGWVQVEGQDVAEVRPGDFIWFAPGSRHWEGATPHHAMTYVAVQEEDAGSVRFLETVSDEEYEQGPM